MATKAISNRAMSNKIEEDSKSKILKFKEILFLAKQRGRDFMLERIYLQAQ